MKINLAHNQTLIINGQLRYGSYPIEMGCETKIQITNASIKMFKGNKDNNTITDILIRDLNTIGDIYFYNLNTKSPCISMMGEHIYCSSEDIQKLISLIA